MTTPTPADMPRTTTLTAVAPLPDPGPLERAQRAYLLALEFAVSRRRLEGASWADIGAELGTTRQAAHKRWRYLDEYGVAITRLPSGQVVARHQGTGATWDMRSDPRVIDGELVTPAAIA